MQSCHKFPRGRTSPCAILLLACLALAGCSAERLLMPTPNLYARGIEKPFPAPLAEEQRTVDVKILYATDRRPEPQADGSIVYGTGRDPSMAVGVGIVRIGGGASWEELAADARNGIRESAINLDVLSVNEIARTPRFPLRYTVENGVPTVDPEAQRRLRAVGETLNEGLRPYLATVPRKEVLLFVHGVANSFEDALFTTAELWHYMGRQFVPVAYTWPAGRSGLLRGYTYDRESSEFTVFHFKSFLRWLAALPEVEGIHIISHSRGTDVVSTGIRELIIETRAAGKNPLETLKLQNVVLAAPDINLDVAMQRTATEYFSAGMRRLTIYSSPNDKAIGVSEFLFGGGLRIGQADFYHIDDLFKSRVSTTNQALVEYNGRSHQGLGHDYFRTNPAVSSDLVLTVRYDRDPGVENGRPLKHNGSIFWSIGDDYLASPQDN